MVCLDLVLVEAASMSSDRRLVFPSRSRPPSPRLSFFLPIALDDDTGASSTGGSLATATPGVLHFIIVVGCVASSVLASPHCKRVSCILALLLTVQRGHVRALSRLHYDGLGG